MVPFVLVLHICKTFSETELDKNFLAKNLVTLNENKIYLTQGMYNP